MKMPLSRRKLMIDTLFGAGWLGLRSLATGIPLAVLADPRKASAQTVACASNPNAQYLLLSSSEAGDPLNANVPGMYDNGLDTAIAHPPDPTMAKTALTVGAGTQSNAALPWAQLDADILKRTCFFHHGTYTVVHPDLQKVMSLQGFVSHHEMLVSMFASSLAGALDTVQAEPVALGPRSASEGITVGGRPQPILSPSALASLLASPTGVLGQLQQIRDADLDRLNDWYKENGNAGQQSFLDRYARSQQQARGIGEGLLTQLAAIKDNEPDSQVQAAIILFQMNVSPVVSIHIPFGGDNHSDKALAGETKETVAGVQTIGNMWTALKAAELQDKVTFATMNVFGRTLVAKDNANGRGHHGDHHVTVMIGNAFDGGVGIVGGVEMGKDDFQAQSIAQATGQGVAGNAGDIPFSETLSAMGKTLGAAVGVDCEVLDNTIRGGAAVKVK
ncbi:MAG TPA: hypothetical protein VLW85_18450 [Myxococcales bacterium]|nr:hypothetical protein [Myxococcales bacterium]